MNIIIIIPTGCTLDLHICGRCKTQFNVLSEFLEHKVLGSCGPSLDHLKESSEKSLRSVGVASPPFFDSKENTVIVNTDNFKCIEESFKTSEQQQTGFDDQYHIRDKTLTDEEDVAALLASQLANQDDLECGPEDSVAAEAALPLAERIMKDEKSAIKDEDKVLYRGKMRSVFHCNVEGCRYKSRLKKDIRRHARVHTGERPFKCLTCGKAFTRDDKLLLHQRIHNGDKRYKCPNCPYAAIDSGSLIRHLRIHNDERPYRCILCPYRARDNSQLTVHIRSHTGDSPFICMHEKCRAAFKTQSDLKRHMGIHAAVKPHSCTLCPYKSTFKGGLKNHMQKHHAEPSDFSCGICSVVFKTPRKLKSHLKKCHNDQVKHVSEQTEMPKYEKKRKKPKSKGDLIGTLAKGFSCRQCDASFVCWGSLKTHERFHRNTKQIFDRNLESELEDARFYRHCDDQSHSGKEIVRSKEHTVLTFSPLVEKQTVTDGLLGDTYITENISLDENIRTAEMLASFTQPLQATRQFMSASSIFPNDELHSSQLGLTQLNCSV